MLQFIALLIAAGVAYYYFKWPAALAVVVAYLAIGDFYRMWRAEADRQAAGQVPRTPLSDAEEIHMDLMEERDQRMAERQATKNKYR